METAKQKRTAAVREEEKKIERGKKKERKVWQGRYVTNEVCGRGERWENKTYSDRKMSAFLSQILKGRKEKQKVEIGERDGGELSSLPAVHESTDFTITKGRKKGRKREREAAVWCLHRSRCLSLCGRSTGLHLSARHVCTPNLKSSQLPVYRWHTIKQTNKHISNLYETQVAWEMMGRNRSGNVTGLNNSCRQQRVGDAYIH